MKVTRMMRIMDPIRDAFDAFAILAGPRLRALPHSCFTNGGEGGNVLIHHS